MKLNNIICLGRALFYNTKAMFAVFVLILVAGSLGQAARWDLLDQISMADNFVKKGLLYPLADSSQPTGVSVYFPGVAFLAIALYKIGIEFYLVETMLLLACLIVLIFILTQKLLINEISGIACSWNKFVPFSIAIVFILTPNWLSYAREFKPDTVAITLGFLGLILSSFLRADAKLPFILIGALLCSIALIFKQQYISFIFGISLYCIFMPNKVRMIFLFLLLTFSTLVIIFSYSNSDLWFWNVTVLSDDGFISLKAFIIDNYKTMLASIFFFFISSTFLSELKKSLNGKDFDVLSISHPKILFFNPWIWVVVPSAIAALASAFKVGGNSGNTQLALILFLPLIILTYLNLKRQFVVGIAWIAILSMLPTLYAGPKAYIEASQLRTYLLKDLPSKPPLVLTGSDVYFASRIYINDSNIVNYWSVSLREGSDVYESLKSVLDTITPDRIVVENWPSNKSTILADSRYKILYENKLGIVATLALSKD